MSSDHPVMIVSFKVLRIGSLVVSVFNWLRLVVPKLIRSISMFTVSSLDISLTVVCSSIASLFLRLGSLESVSANTISLPGL